jgi:hypothetical protein
MSTTTTASPSTGLRWTDDDRDVSDAPPIDEQPPFALSPVPDGVRTSDPPEFENAWLAHRYRARMEHHDDDEAAEPDEVPEPPEPTEGEGEGAEPAEPAEEENDMYYDAALHRKFVYI